MKTMKIIIKQENHMNRNEKHKRKSYEKNENHKKKMKIICTEMKIIKENHMKNIKIVRTYENHMKRN